MNTNTDTVLNDFPVAEEKKNKKSNKTPVFKNYEDKRELAEKIFAELNERFVEVKIGKKIRTEGQFRSYNSYEGERSRLVLTVFAKEIIFLDESEETDNPNTVELNGYICKKPIYRQTPFGREISDILLAVNRAYNKSDYIPAIAWGRNARFCQNLEVGQNVKIYGRVQSRMYEKKYEDGSVIKKVAYEVSIGSLEVVKPVEGALESENDSESKIEEAM